MESPPVTAGEPPVAALAVNSKSESPRSSLDPAAASSNAPAPTPAPAPAAPAPTEALDATVAEALEALRRTLAPALRELHNDIAALVDPAGEAAKRKQAFSPNGTNPQRSKPRAPAASGKFRWQPPLTPGAFEKKAAAATPPSNRADGSPEAGRSERSPERSGAPSAPPKPPKAARKPRKSRKRAPPQADAEAAVDVDVDDDDMSVLFMASSTPQTPATPATVPAAPSGGSSGPKRSRTKKVKDPTVIEVAPTPKPAAARPSSEKGDGQPAKRVKRKAPATLSARGASAVLSAMRGPESSGGYGGAGPAPKVNLAALWSANVADHPTTRDAIAEAADPAAGPAPATVTSSIAMLDVLKTLQNAGRISAEVKQNCKKILMASAGPATGSDTPRAWLEAALTRCLADGDYADCAETLNALPTTHENAPSL